MVVDLRAEVADLFFQERDGVALFLYELAELLGSRDVESGKTFVVDRSEVIDFFPIGKGVGGSQSG